MIVGYSVVGQFLKATVTVRLRTFTSSPVLLVEWISYCTFQSTKCSIYNVDVWMW